METKKRVAIVGLGNVGSEALEAVLLAEDLELAGVVRRKAAPLPGHESVPVVESIEALGRVDGAVVSGPTREVERIATGLLERGISTADSFDLHGAPMLEHRARLDAVAKAHGAVAVVGAGWDPGADSIVRALIEALAPIGTTSTTFGPGMSMGHSVAARAIPGVRDAISMTLPASPGVHRRKVYVEVEDPAQRQAVEAAIKADPYFVKDETEVVFVDRAADHFDLAHGVQILREGQSGAVGGQRFSWEMRNQNPSLTAQAMVASLRAGFRQAPGCYTLIELPVVDLLLGGREGWIARLV